MLGRRLLLAPRRLLSLPHAPKHHTRSFSSGFRYIEIEPAKEDEKTLVVSINRPEIHNAFNEDLIEELTRTFNTLESSYPKTRSVVLTGKGPSFSAGADLNWMKKMADYTQEQNEKDSHQLFNMFYAIRTCPLPVIGRVNGPALGGGAGLVSVCDMAFAVEGAKFGFTEVKLGLIPAVISPFVMEKIGRNNCSRFSSPDAKRIGLIQDHFPSEEELDKWIVRMCREIAQGGPQAAKICKRLIRRVSEMNYEDPQTKSFVASEIAKARVSAEGQSGLSAFLSKQKPDWIQ